jgi:hypothetical protein
MDLGGKTDRAWRHCAIGITVPHAVGKDERVDDDQRRPPGP